MQLVTVCVCVYCSLSIILDPHTRSHAHKQTHRRSQHCEVEKKRRERMNRYMAELAQMIPACNAVPRKLDKLSILKMAVDHMKNLQGDCQAPSEYKPGFLTDDELKKLIVEVGTCMCLYLFTV